MTLTWLVCRATRSTGRARNVGGTRWVLSEPDGGFPNFPRPTAPLGTEFSDRQLITDFVVKPAAGHSLLIPTNALFTAETMGCADDAMAIYLSEGALQTTVGENDHHGVPGENVCPPGSTAITAANLPVKCYCVLGQRNLV